MVWFNIEFSKWGNLKYTPLNPIEVEYPPCDANGNILKKVSGKFDKGYFINEATGEKLEKAYKLVNGKASDGFKGRIKEVNKFAEVEMEEVSNLLIEKEFIAVNQKMYDELIQSGKAIKFRGFFGNGFKSYKCYISPNPLYKGFLDIRVGTTDKSEILKEVVRDLDETNRLQDRLKEIDLGISKVNKMDINDFEL